MPLFHRLASPCEAVCPRRGFFLFRGPQPGVIGETRAWVFRFAVWVPLPLKRWFYYDYGSRRVFTRATAMFHIYLARDAGKLTGYANGGVGPHPTRLFDRVEVVERL